MGSQEEIEFKEMSKEKKKESKECFKGFKWGKKKQELNEEVKDGETGLVLSINEEILLDDAENTSRIILESSVILPED
jgi:hypothetical protein